EPLDAALAVLIDEDMTSHLVLLAERPGPLSAFFPGARLSARRAELIAERPEGFAVVSFAAINEEGLGLGVIVLGEGLAQVEPTQDTLRSSETTELDDDKLPPEVVTQVELLPVGVAQREVRSWLAHRWLLVCEVLG